MDNISININELETTIITKDKDASTKVKTVYTKDFFERLKSGNDLIKTPFLPGEYGTHQYVKNSNGDTFILFSEPAKDITLTYYQDAYSEYFEEYDEYFDYINESMSSTSHFSYDDDYVKINTVSPILLWMVKISGDESSRYFSDVRLFALKQPVLTGNEQLYRAPFSNIYEDGIVCWGSVSLKVDSIRVIQGLSTLYFNAVSNTDLDAYRCYSANEHDRPFFMHIEIAEQYNKNKTEEQVFDAKLNYLHRNMLYFTGETDSYDSPQYSVMRVFNDFCEGGDS